MAPTWAPRVDYWQADDALNSTTTTAPPPLNGSEARWQSLAVRQGRVQRRFTATVFSTRRPHNRFHFARPRFGTPFGRQKRTQKTGLVPANRARSPEHSSNQAATMQRPKKQPTSNQAARRQQQSKDTTTTRQNQTATKQLHDSNQNSEATTTRLLANSNQTETKPPHVGKQAAPNRSRTTKKQQTGGNHEIPKGQQNEATQPYP